MAVPVRGLIERFAFFLAMASAILLLLLGRAGNPLVERIRMQTADALAPVLEAASRPVELVRELSERVHGVAAIYAENERLRRENERLLQWQEVARRLAHENQNLRAMANAVAEPRPSFITARVIATSGGAFVRTLLVNAGAQDGVAKGQAVVTPDGLVGRIVEAAGRTARVLLVTDLNSRVPVVLESSRLHAILAGDNSDLLALNFLPAEATVRVGERVVTSGEGGLIPPGIPVGIVAAVADGDTLVQPVVDWSRLERVSVLDYDLPGILPTTQEAGATGPL